MYSIDKFIEQLILSGLAGSFLDIINNHYMKISIIYSILSGVEIKDIESLSCSNDDSNDSLTVDVTFKEEKTLGNIGDHGDFSVQTFNDGCNVRITVSNLYRNEDDVYEARLNRCTKTDIGKWS